MVQLYKSLCELIVTVFDRRDSVSLTLALLGAAHLWLALYNLLS